MSATVMEAITIMWQGMAGIMVVMGILAGVVAVLSKAGDKKDK